jgi:hypothetical protein
LFTIPAGHRLYSLDKLRFEDLDGETILMFKDVEKGAQSLINLLAEQKIKVHLDIQSDWYFYTAMLQTTKKLVISSTIEDRLFPAKNGAKSIPLEESIPNITTKSYNLAFEKEFKDSSLYKRFCEVSW